MAARYHHYEAKDLNTRESYEAWVTAATIIGQGPSTPVIKLQPSATVPAAIITYGQLLTVAWRVDVKLACPFVGVPRPQSDWKVYLDATLTVTTTIKPRLEIDSSDNTLTLRNVQRNHSGNYTCTVRNSIGTDQISYQLVIQQPPDPPQLQIAGTGETTVQLTWRAGYNGGSPILTYHLALRRGFDDWSDHELDRYAVIGSTYQLGSLQCGTRYQITLSAANKVGTGAASSVETAQTRGDKPIAPARSHFIRTNVTAIQLELAAWQDGGCAIIYFTVEFRRDRNTGSSNSVDWIVVSSNVPPHSRFAIPDLEPATAYSLRITAHNNAGATNVVYAFETLGLTSIGSSAAESIGGGGSGGLNVEINDDVNGEINSEQVHGLFANSQQVLLLAILSVFSASLAVMGICFCWYSRMYFYVIVYFPSNI